MIKEPIILILEGLRKLAVIDYQELSTSEQFKQSEYYKGYIDALEKAVKLFDENI